MPLLRSCLLAFCAALPLSACLQDDPLKDTSPYALPICAGLYSNLANTDPEQADEHQDRADLMIRVLAAEEHETVDNARKTVGLLTVEMNKEPMNTQESAIVMRECDQIARRLKRAGYPRPVY